VIPERNGGYFNSQSWTDVVRSFSSFETTSIGSTGRNVNVTRAGAVVSLVRVLLAPHAIVTSLSPSSPPVPPAAALVEQLQGSRDPIAVIMVCYAVGLMFARSE